MALFERRWWNDESLKVGLMAKIESNEGWHVLIYGTVPARVIKIIYAGYKVLLPDNTECIVNPESNSIVDISSHNYGQQVPIWCEEQRLLKLQNDEREAFALAARLAFEERQRTCLHQSTQTTEVARAAGCDINDTACCECGKILRRSWSTAYERDPDDHISDWEWWVRECMKLYQQEPKQSNYHIVEKIG